MSLDQAADLVLINDQETQDPTAGVAIVGRGQSHTAGVEGRRGHAVKRNQVQDIPHLQKLNCMLEY